MKIVFIKIILLSIIVIPTTSLAQEDLEKLIKVDSSLNEKVYSTFKSGSLINLKTIETLHKKELDFRVDHRFGDIAGSSGGPKNFFGLDNSTDIRIGFEYGIIDDLNIGISRAKGAADQTQLYEGNLKYRFLEQTIDNRIPLSIALFVSTTISAAESSEDKSMANSYNNFRDRLVYVSQLIIARKFNSSFSLIMSPTYVHRNYTAFGDQNSIFALGIGGRLKMTKRLSLIADYFIPFKSKTKLEYMESTWDKKYYKALGVGLEIETGGHVFSLNFTNAKSIQEGQIIPETYSSWSKGQFRWGFGITRRFSFGER